MTQYQLLESHSINSVSELNVFDSGTLSKRASPFEIGTKPMNYGRRMINTWDKIGSVVEDGEPGVSQRDVYRRLTTD